MTKRTRYITILIALVAVGVLLLSMAGLALAGDDNNGNHQAVWSLSVDEHGQLSPGDWGPHVSDFASNGMLKPYGVSDGVHLAKDNGPKDK